MTNNVSDLAAGLTTWARGSRPTEAAVKLLIETGTLHKVAHLAQPLKHPDGPRAGFNWVDVAQWFDAGTGMSGGENRIVAAALSLAGARPVDLSDVMTGVDHDNAQAVLDACAHAAGLPPSTMVL